MIARSTAGLAGLRLHIAKEYAQTLHNPWEHGPIHLGYDCMVPTTLATAYRKMAIDVNADGSFAVFAAPRIRGLYTNTAGASVATWVHQQYQNETQITNLLSSARLVSGGLRVLCNFAATSRSGTLFAGALSFESVTQMNVHTPDALWSSQHVLMGVGSSGAAATCRPIDNSAYEFAYGTIDTTATAASLYNHLTSPFIVGVGFPADTKVWIEATLNFEGVAKQEANAPAAPAESTTTTAADVFPTSQQLFNAVKEAVSDDRVMSFAESVAGSVHPLLRNAVNLGRTAFGRGGPHVQWAQRVAPQLRIEEIVD